MRFVHYVLVAVEMGFALPMVVEMGFVLPIAAEMMFVIAHLLVVTVVVRPPLTVGLLYTVVVLLAEVFVSFFAWLDDRHCLFAMPGFVLYFVLLFQVALLCRLQYHISLLSFSILLHFSMKLTMYLASFFDLQIHMQLLTLSTHMQL